MPNNLYSMGGSEQYDIILQATYLLASIVLLALQAVITMSLEVIITL